MFLQLLKNAQKASGLTQEQVAQKLGKPQSYVSKCFSSERRMDMVEVLMFCQAIEKPLAELAAEFERQANGLNETKKD